MGRVTIFKVYFNAAVVYLNCAPKYTVIRTKLINIRNEFKHTDKYEFNSSEKSYNFSLNSKDRKIHKK